MVKLIFVCPSMSSFRALRLNICRKFDPAQGPQAGEVAVNVWLRPNCHTVAPWPGEPNLSWSRGHQTLLSLIQPCHQVQLPHLWLLSWCHHHYFYHHHCLLLAQECHRQPNLARQLGSHSARSSFCARIGRENMTLLILKSCLCERWTWRLQVGLL